jgi:hypothetical protein
MHSRWNILYRGPLSSCNYACGYCPFAKTRNTAAELRDDAARLTRFVSWVETQAPRQIGLLFTPWGEALIHRTYQRALLTLSAMPHVYRAAIQTNLACPLEWLEEASRESLALWCTFHPTETTLERFVAKIYRLKAMGIRHSVGVVGLREHVDLIRALRTALPATTYLWVNAYKRQTDYYTSEDVAALTAIDKLFPLNNQRHASLGRPCQAGHTSFTVDGEGVARRCHFIAAPLGSIYEADFATRLAPQPALCSNESCGCYIGYAHLQPLGLEAVYGDGLLERVPLAVP